MDEKDYNCMTFAAGRKASRTGYVLIGHNEDDSGIFNVYHGYVPSADWAEGTVIPAEDGCAKIPQVSHTYGYFWSEYKKADGGISNADMFINENGVSVVSNSMGGSREDDNNDLVCTEGGIFYNLRRCIAERSKTAREGAEVLMDLMEKYGYASSGRAYTIADRNEAFHFQLVRGKHYIGARIPDDGVVVMPNHYTFRTLHDCEEMFYSDDIIEYAIKRGWYVPKHENDYSDFNFYLAYQSPGIYRSNFNVMRQREGQYRLLGLDPYGTNFSFYHKYTRKLDVSDFADALSSHSESFYKAHGYGPGQSIHEDVDNYPICRTTTQESDIIEYSITDTILHMAQGRPCEVPYVSFLPLAGIPDEINTLKDPAYAMEHHFNPDISAGMAENGVREEIKQSETLSELTFCSSYIFLGKIIRENHAELNKIRENIGALKAEGGLNFRKASESMKTALMESETAIYPEIMPFDAGEGIIPEILTVRFRHAGIINPYSLLIGSTRLSVRNNYSRLASPERLRLAEEGVYEADFGTRELREIIKHHGKYVLYVAGSDVDGTPFAGTVEADI